VLAILIWYSESNGASNADVSQSFFERESQGIVIPKTIGSREAERFSKLRRGVLLPPVVRFVVMFVAVLSRHSECP
jgi:hypothetical protein